MATPFSQSLRALALDGHRAHGAIVALSVVVLGGWMVWFARSEVAVYEVSESARLEVAEAPHAIDAPVAGRVAVTNIVLGREFQEGDVLVELDAQSERLRLAEERTRLSIVEPELVAIRRELEAHAHALDQDREATLTAIDEGRARHDQSELAARLLSEEAKRATTLHGGGAIPELDMLRAQAQADTQRAASEALALGMRRLEGEQRTRKSQGLTRVEELRREAAILEGRRATSTATIDVLSADISKRTIRAPAAGRIGELAAFRVGGYVREGERLGTVIPHGALKAIADFAPAAALGRIEPGQLARLRLDGFPWAQYGAVNAVVSRVGLETREGRVRVELDVVRDPLQRIPLQHGLAGAMEIEVEKVSPVRLALRSIGKTLGAPAEGRRGEGK